MTFSHIHAEILSHASPQRAVVSRRFFKTGTGQYGEGDEFIGLSVPVCRTIAKQFRAVDWSMVHRLLTSAIHEERLIALLIMVEQYQHGDSVLKELCVDRYVAHTEYINNWDLVDLSADKILGEWLLTSPNWVLLKRLAYSHLIWERRIAMIATFAEIKRGKSQTALKVVKILLHDEHDLIQKAVGWMLREVGKRCGERNLTVFLDQHATSMPRTMLRYSIERLSPRQKAKYMEKISSTVKE